MAQLVEACDACIDQGCLFCRGDFVTSVCLCEGERTGDDFRDCFLVSRELTATTGRVYCQIEPETLLLLVAGGVALIVVLARVCYAVKASRKPKPACDCPQVNMPPYMRHYYRYHGNPDCPVHGGQGQAPTVSVAIAANDEVPLAEATLDQASRSSIEMAVAAQAADDHATSQDSTSEPERAARTVSISSLELTSNAIATVATTTTTFPPQR